MRRHFLWRLIWIQTVCKGLQNSVPAVKELIVEYGCNVAPSGGCGLVYRVERPTRTMEHVLRSTWGKLTATH
ncbi:hypothetical protein DPMN_048203 [Dreissena polymorpha]|uniref:Secreted protein n=1 Tax=Dreissena polymorpha TaxID=45954 RepID=A0A9D4D9I2_DREPO|nr:hypothetical protein DPMN_048203 [Dreissena polymorpha]